MWYVSCLPWILLTYMVTSTNVVCFLPLTAPPAPPAPPFGALPRESNGKVPKYMARFPKPLQGLHSEVIGAWPMVYGPLGKVVIVLQLDAFGLSCPHFLANIGGQQKKTPDQIWAFLDMYRYRPGESDEHERLPKFQGGNISQLAFFS